MNEEWKEHPELPSVFISSEGKCKRVFKNREKLMVLFGNRYQIKIKEKVVKIPIKDIFNVLFPDGQLDIRPKTIFQDLPNEVWKDIPSYEGLYQASSLGRLRSLDRFTSRGFYLRGAIIVQSTRKDDYLNTALTTKDKKRKLWLVHRLVTITFISNPLHKLFINHKDGNKKNNRVDNLEWCTRSENCQHAWDTGLQTKRGKTKHPETTTIIPINIHWK